MVATVGLGDGTCCSCQAERARLGRWLASLWAHPLVTSLGSEVKIGVYTNAGGPSQFSQCLSASPGKFLWQFEIRAL